MSRNPIIPFALSLSILAGSCFTSQISLDVLEPAKIILPSSLQHISILPMPGPPSAHFDSLEFFWLAKGTDIYEIKMGYLHGIHDVLMTSPRFRKVILSDTTGTLYKNTGRLFWDDLQRICAHDTTDFVLALTRAISRDHYPQGVNNAYYGVKDDNWVGSYSLVDYSIINKTRWIFYEPNKEKIAARYEFADTIRISGDLVSPEIPALLYDACYLTGERTGKKLSPYWMTVSRNLYTGPGKDLKDAARFASENHWFKAALLWNGLVDHRNNKIASRAAYNLALAYEQDDILDQAFIWISFADSISGNKLTSSYRKRLDSRLKNKTFLDQQLSGY
jgi:hypothetical protein